MNSRKYALGTQLSLKVARTFPLEIKLMLKSYFPYFSSLLRTNPSFDKFLIYSQNLINSHRRFPTVENGVTLLRNFLLTFQNQHFNYTWLKQIRQNDLCVDHDADEDRFFLRPCSDEGTALRWLHKSTNSKLVGHAYLFLSAGTRISRPTGCLRCT